ncbi:MAG: hypothetical protein JXO49_00445 [Deltaproteobacteria bacterium]|nr:hypothetical protein [Candidatus Anaeroferrophillus wilburensis]MBN2887793.1 hypothetical protein [Deltaproteobacteria bacterium]
MFEAVHGVVIKHRQLCPEFIDGGHNLTIIDLDEKLALLHLLTFGNSNLGNTAAEPGSYPAL